MTGLEGEREWERKTKTAGGTVCAKVQRQERGVPWSVTGPPGGSVVGSSGDSGPLWRLQLQNSAGDGVTYRDWEVIPQTQLPCHGTLPRLPERSPRGLPGLLAPFSPTVRFLSGRPQVLPAIGPGLGFGDLCTCSKRAQRFVPKG